MLRAEFPEAAATSGHSDVGLAWPRRARDPVLPPCMERVVSWRCMCPGATLCSQRLDTTLSMQGVQALAASAAPAQRRGVVVPWE